MYVFLSKLQLKDDVEHTKIANLIRMNGIVLHIYNQK